MDVVSSRTNWCFACLIAISCYLVWTLNGSLHSSTFSHIICDDSLTAIGVPHAEYAQFAGPDRKRLSDTVDTFANYKYRDECGISSLDLHFPFSPLCQDRPSLLEAMSNGGRPGFDTPYIPRGCDMRWYTSDEACQILGRFERVVLIGDSIMRHIANAMWIIIRADLGLGAINDRLITDQPNGCMCGPSITYKPCSMLLFKDSEEAEAVMPENLMCKPGSFAFSYHNGEAYPLSEDHLRNFTKNIPRTKPAKPIPVIVNHATHNNVYLDITNRYMDQIVGHLNETIPWFTELDSQKYMPRLYVSSNSGSWQREFERQTMNSMARFEREAKPMMEQKDFEFLGLWNMTAQATSVDGLHSTMEGNLLKAMMVLNWLDQLDLLELSNDRGHFEGFDSVDGEYAQLEEFSD